jgi:pimeloyl-ACP methyl ester carboxylesterase
MKHFAADDGESIHVEIAGAGTPLVLLHGWTASHQEWSPLVAALARHHQVIRWDARGHGGHPLAAATRPTVRRMAQDLRNLLDHYALRDVVLVGHSMGALTIWEYLRAFGTTGVRKLCLIDQSPRLVTDGDWLGIWRLDRGAPGGFAGELRRLHESVPPRSARSTPAPAASTTRTRRAGSGGDAAAARTQRR